jgi:CelD/BcsL family acetyltransferase involved in cellulose biosynthesis
MREEWSAFLRASNHDNLFHSWEWLAAWWATFEAPHREFWFHVARDDSGRLHGLFPLMRVYSAAQRPFHLRVVQMTGRGIEGYAGGSEYMTFLTPPIRIGSEGPVMEALLRHLGTLRSTWDMALLDNLVDQHPTTDALSRAVAGRHLVRQRQQEINYVLRLPETYEEFLDQLSSDRRKALRRSGRMLEKTWAVDVASLSSRADLDRFLTEYYDLVARRHDWTPSAPKAMFLRRLGEDFLATGSLRFSMLRLNGRAVATMLGFAYNRRYYLYKSAFDPDPAFSRASPGTYLRCRVAEQLIAEGLTELDYLIGASDYKREWSNIQRNLTIVSLYSPSPSTMLRLGINKAWRGLRGRMTGRQGAPARSALEA